mmetsp:Transcript_3444/g.11663  ORF Transcript_3444/g.11663 Transcript_3444/m.11663 type:complete len:301 (+) Transcript_3444:533-1435(+)
MTRYESNPSAAFINSLFFAAHISVGSHRLSRVSVRRNTTSCVSIKASMSSTSFKTRFVSSSSPSHAWCPGIGINALTPRASTPGKIFLSRAAAVDALGAPPSRQSSNSNSDCRAGLLNDTFPESSSVIARTPQPNKHRATAHPNVPAPRSRHLVLASASASSSGSSRQRISFKFKSTACVARRVGSIDAPKSAHRGPARPFALSSHPTAGPGGSAPASAAIAGSARVMWRHASAEILPAGDRAATTRSLSTFHRAAARSARLRNAHPGCVFAQHASANASATSSALAALPPVSAFHAVRE